MKRLHIIIGISVLAFLVCSNQQAEAQDAVNSEPAKSHNLLSKFYFGGGLGLQLGTSTLIDVSPMVGYKITKKISVGVSPTYKYYRFKNYYGAGDNLKTNVLGGSIFGRFLILENLFAQSEYEILRYKTSHLGTDYLATFKSVLIGGGYRQRISQNASMYLMMLWNLNDTADSPYENPVFRAGVNIGL